MTSGPFDRLPRFHSADTFSCQRNTLIRHHFAILTVEDESRIFAGRWMKRRNLKA
jgi:hypothetical protein